jgi:hypothetical protein
VARAVYSKNFASLTGHTGTWQLPTLGADETVVIRDVDVYMGGGAHGTFFLQGESGQAIWRKDWDATNEDTAQQWRGRQVIGPGQAFACSSDQPADITISGYLLTAT